MATAHTAGQALVELDCPRLLERLDQGIGVGADGQPAAGVTEPSRPADAVGQVALGGRAQAAVRAGSPEQRDVLLGDMGGMDRGEAVR